MDKKYDFIATGYPSMDRIVKLNNNPKIGLTSIITNKDFDKIHYGGCNVNVSVLCSKLGMNTLPLMRVGADFSATGFKEYLESANIDVDKITVIEDEKTSSSYLVLDENNSHITLFYPGAMDDKYKTPMDENLIKNTKYGIITVGPPTFNMEFYNLLKKNNIPIVFGMKCDFDAFSKELLLEIMKNSQVIFMNEGEKRELESCLGLSDITVLLNGEKTKVIIVTMGNKGSTIYERHDSYFIKIAHTDKIVDTTGVGDAYIAGFMYAYINGKSLKSAGQLGSTLSSFIIEDIGCLTNIPTWEQLEKRYFENYKEGF